MKQQRPWIKSIIITAYPSEETLSEAKKLGAVDYLIKPVMPDELENLVRDTLRSVAAEPTVTAPVRERPEVSVPAEVAPKGDFVIGVEGLRSLIEGLSREMEVVGPTARRGKYVFDRISDYAALCLDYDVSVLPPTVYLFPPRENLLTFKMGNHSMAEPTLGAAATGIVGVHPYDIRAIELLDEVFLTTDVDPNYSARRNNTIIIGVECTHPSANSFASSMGTDLVESGFELFLTPLDGDYMVRVGSDKGAELLARYAEVREATGEEIGKQRAVRDGARAEYKRSLDVPRETLPRLLTNSYDDPYWETAGQSCLSCGSCVMVCPTCVCFDVQDDVALDLEEGARLRRWDGCVLVDFAKVATGENFRHDKVSRLRHRIYRKGKYVLERYGKVGCVGCGRCATACLAEIASPLDAFNALAESARTKRAAISLARAARTETDLYVPRLADLVAVSPLTATEKLFEFQLWDGQELGHRPGQFVEISVMGIGEAPISISSSPTRGSTFQLAVRNVGGVTNALHNLPAGSTVGIRGPFGNGFPLDALEGKDLLFVAGGIGLFPLRSLVQYVLDRRESFGRAVLLFGSRSPAERLFLDELSAWDASPHLEFHETVDKGDSDWSGNVGVITTLIPAVDVDARNTVATVVGPPIMYRFVIGELKKKDLPDENIILSLERRMKCGVGKCGHCQINDVYVCQEGPVFTLARLRTLREAV